MSKALTALLSKAYKLEDEKIAELLEKSDDEQAAELLALDATRVKDWKTKVDEAKSEGRNKGKAETLGKFEKQLRDEFKIDEDDLVGVELVKKIVDQARSEAATAAGKGKVTVTEDDIKKSPLYIQMQQDYSTKIAAKDKEWSDKLAAREAEISKKEVLGKVRTSAEEMLMNELKPILPTDEKIAKKQVGWFLDEISQLGNYEIDEKGNFIIKDADGKPLEDEHGQIRDFASLVKERAGASFQFNKSEERSSTGNGGQQSQKTPVGQAQGGKTVAKLAIPKTVAEMAKIANDKTIPIEERTRVADEFQKLQKQPA